MQSFKTATVAVIMLSAIVSYIHVIHWDATITRATAVAQTDPPAQEQQAN